MGMGKRKPVQETLFITYDSLPRSSGHPFYVRLNELLDEAGFDRWLEKRCVQYYEQEEPRGQPSIPPGVYFRMLLVGYFEGIDSQRGIAFCSVSPNENFAENLKRGSVSFTGWRVAFANYFDGGSFQLLDMPYALGAMSMVALLPKELDGLVSLEKTVTAKDVESSSTPGSRSRPTTRSRT